MKTGFSFYFVGAHAINTDLWKETDKPTIYRETDYCQAINRLSGYGDLSDHAGWHDFTRKLEVMTSHEPDVYIAVQWRRTIISLPNDHLLVEL